MHFQEEKIRTIIVSEQAKNLGVIGWKNEMGEF